MAQGHHPFGAILVAPDHTTVLLEQGNVDTVNHAESTLMRRAFAEFEPDFFAGLHALHHSGALRDVC